MSVNENNFHEYLSLERSFQTLSDMLIIHHDLLQSVVLLTFVIASFRAKSGAHGAHSLKNLFVLKTDPGKMENNDPR